MAKTTKAQADEARDYLDRSEGIEGFEQINAQTSAIPFLRIAQPLSPQINEEGSQYIEGLKRGQYFNTVTREIYGSEIDVIALKFEYVYIEWLPEREGFVDYHTPENALKIASSEGGSTEFGKWRAPNGNILQENYVYFLLIVGAEAQGIVVFPLFSTSIKTAKEWNRMMTTHIMEDGQKALPHWLVWKLTTAARNKGEYHWHTPEVRFIGIVDRDQSGIVKTERKALPDRRVDYAQIDAPVEGGSDSEPTDY